MKIHGIIENDCEDFIAIWRTNIELALHRVICWLSICPSDSYARTRRPRPSSRQEVTMVGHFHSCFTKYSQESNQVYIYEALPNHMLWNFWLKIPDAELHRCHLPNPPSSANFFLSISSSLLVEWIICVIVRRLSECLVTGTSQRTINGLILMSHFLTQLAIAGRLS